MKNNFITTLTTIILLLLSLGGGYFIVQKKLNIFTKKTIGSSSPNYLFLTNPVNEFTGKIDKISGNTIWISRKYTITPLPSPPNAPTNVPESVITVPPLPPSRIFTYKVNIAPYTTINRPLTPIIYLFKKITPTPTPKLTMKDIREGQIVTVYTEKDLRVLNSDEFEAYSIKLSPIINTISGKIAELREKDNIIILKAVPPKPAGSQEPTPEKPEEIEYAISVNSDTEISRMGPTEAPKKDITPKPAKPVSYKISDLKKNIQIVVYSDADVIENTKLNALRIEPPIDLAPTPTPKST